MSAFSRGVFLRPRCLNLITQRLGIRLSHAPRASVPRNFTTSQFLNFAAKKTRLNTYKIKPNSIENSLQSASLPTYQSFASSLAQKSHPTILYAAPSHTLYILSSYSAALFCFSYAAYNFNAHVTNAPADLARWVPIAFGGVCFLVACFGGWLVLGPARLIKNITALPASQTLTKGKRGIQPGGLGVEVELRKMFPLPGFPARKIVATPEEMTLNRRIYFAPQDTRQSALERLTTRRSLEREQEEERRKSIMLAPFRHASKAFGQLFRAMARTWSREGFLELGVKGQVYKLDVTGGWALDEGKALDRLVRVKP